ncbi:hypothetical protein ACI68E_002821 [Malassezia pachydermatis]
MSLPLSLKSLALGSALAPHTLEIYVRPFSAKILINFHEQVRPLLFGEDAPFKNKVRVVLRPVPQPWHASSTYLHETALAIARLAPTDPDVLANPETNPFYQYSVALMRESSRWYSSKAHDKTADQIRSELAALAVDVLSEQPRKAGTTPTLSVPSGEALGQEIRKLTRDSDDGNTGTEVVPDLKYCIKLGRQTGVHVTPTVLWNGIIEPSVSSSFSASEWRSFFDERIPKANM